MQGQRLRSDLKNSVAFSRDGRKLAAENGALIVWDVVSSWEIGRWVKDTLTPVRDFAFGPDGTTLVVAEANVQILEVPTLMNPSLLPK
jgi:WD40 repeat protein